MCTIAQHSGKGHCGFVWEAQMLTFSKSETPKPIDKIFCRIDNVVVISDRAKNQNNRLHRGTLTHNLNISLCAPFSTFLGSRITRTKIRTKVMAQNIRVSRAGSGFWGVPLKISDQKGSKIHKTAKFCPPNLNIKQNQNLE